MGQDWGLEVARHGLRVTAGIARTPSYLIKLLNMRSKGQESNNVLELLSDPSVGPHTGHRGRLETPW